jgi:hypothetical protein
MNAVSEVNRVNGTDAKREFEILNDGSQVEVTYISGLKEVVKIRKVPIRDMQSLARAWGQEDKEIPVYTQRPAEWAQTLIDESWEAVMEEGRRLNADPFGRWFSRQTKALEVMGKTSAVSKIVEQAMLQAQRP